MRDSLAITDELIRLQRAVDAAFAALGEWDAPPSQWSAERREEWEARWQTYRTAVRELAAHPVMRHAAEGGFYGRMQTSLRRAARAGRDDTERDA
jgi:hypothetical protein